MDEGYQDEDAGDIRRVFYKEEFNETFRKLMVLRVESRLMNLLGLEDYRDEIMQHRIATLFNGKGGTKTVTVDENLHIGTPDELQLLQLKQKRKK